MRRCIFGWTSLFLLAACQGEVAPVDPGYNKIPLTSYCIGRSSITLPAGAALHWSQAVDIFTIDRDNSSSRDTFEAEVGARRSQLRAMSHDSEESRLSDFKQVNRDLSLILFRESEVSTHVYKVEAYYWPGPWGYKLSGEIAREDRDYLQLLPGLASEIKVIQDPNSPVKAGFCIDGGYIDSASLRLSANVNGRIRGWQSSSFWFGVFENESAPGDEAARIDHELNREREAAKDVLSAEPEAANDPAFPKSIAVLRDGDRILAGLAGEELVWRKELGSGAVAYRFRWQAKGDFSSGVAVGLDIGDDSGIRSAPSEQDMFALWDAMLSSFSNNNAK